MLIPLRLLYKTLKADKYKLTFTKEDVERRRDIINFKRLGRFWVNFLVINVNKENKIDSFEAWGTLFGIFQLEDLVIPFRIPELVSLEDIEKGLVTAGDLLQMGLNWLERLMKEMGYEQ
jgi:hypothetical protein